MEADALYYLDPYATEADVEVVDIAERGGLVIAQLDRTIFFPEGGGQPADQGEIITDTGSLKINTVRSQNGATLHEGKMTGRLERGQPAKAILKWPRRQKYMRVHSAGHLLNDVLLRQYPQLKPLRGKHGDKAFLEYEGELSAAAKDALEASVNEAMGSNLPIRTWECSYAELVDMCKTLPTNLPKHKYLRVLRIGEYEPMPDGGVHVRRTGEIGTITIHHITTEGGRTTIRYGVSGSPSAAPAARAAPRT